MHAGAVSSCMSFCLSLVDCKHKELSLTVCAESPAGYTRTGMGEGQLCIPSCGRHGAWRYGQILIVSDYSSGS